MQSYTKGNKFMFFLIIYFLLLSFGLINLIYPIISIFKLPIYIFLSQCIQFLIPFLLYIVITKNKIKNILPIKSLSIKNIILIILMSLSIQPFMMLVSGISSLFFENDVSNIIEYISKFPLYLGIFAIAFTPAIFEEITFRGIILSEYKDINIKKAAIVNGLFFGIMHLNLQQFLYATILGVFLAYLVYYTKSIFASMICHFTINASQFCMAYFTFNLNSQNIKEEVNNNSLITSLISTSLISAIFIPIFIYLLKKFIYYNNKNISFYEINIDNSKIIDIYFKLSIVLYIIYNVFILYKK